MFLCKVLKHSELNYFLVHLELPFLTFQYSSLLMLLLLETVINLCLLFLFFLFPIQIGSCTNQMGQIAIVSFQSSGPKVIECFNVESRILCMVYIPEEEKIKEINMSLNSENVPTKASNVPTICLGMEEGR